MLATCITITPSLKLWSQHCCSTIKEITVFVLFLPVFTLKFLLCSKIWPRFPYYVLLSWFINLLLSVAVPQSSSVFQHINTLKCGGQLFGGISVNLNFCGVSSWERLRKCTGKNATEVVCLSQSLTWESPWYWCVLLLVLLTFITRLNGKATVFHL